MDTQNNNMPLILPDENDTVIIELDRPRELKLGHKALKRFSALTGKSLAELEEAVQHYDVMAALIYVMLAVDAEKHGEDLTPEQVDDLLEDVPIYQQLQLAGQAINAALVDPDAQEEASGEESELSEESEADPPQAAGTGAEA